MKAETSCGANRASAPKAETKLKGKEVFEAATIKRSENGGFVVEQRYAIEPPAGKSRYDCCPSYVEPKTFTFESFDSLSAHLSSLFK